VIYHKGEKSGLKSEIISLAETIGEHDYKSILKNMALKLNINIDINLDKLHKFLTSKNWSPSLDTLRKLSKKTGSKWQKTILPQQNTNLQENGDVIIYIIRE